MFLPRGTGVMRLMHHNYEAGQEAREAHHDPAKILASYWEVR